MKVLTIAMITIFFSLTSASAESLTLITERGQILIPSLPNWELGKDMFGMPFIYFSPQSKGQRSNISFTSTGVETQMDLSTLGKNMNTYKSMKKNWADTVQASVLSYLPYKLWKNSHGHSIHQVGVEYKHEEKQYVETSFYIDCRGRLIFSKSLRLKENNQHDTDFEKLINETDCGL